MSSGQPNDTLYVSDLDGTLLNANSRISHKSAQIINQLTNRHGLKFTIATSRTIATVVPLMHEIQATLPYIVLSGAAMWHAAERRFDHVRAIPPDVVLRVCNICEHHDVHPFVYRRHGNVIHTHHNGVLSETEQTFIEARNHTPYKHYMLNDPSYHTHSDEAMLIFSMQHKAALEMAYHEIRQTVPCSAVFYHDNIDPSLSLLEVYAEGCTKAAAISDLAKMTCAERVVVFGDNLNDRPMMQLADHSVAVANAVPEILSIADEVIGPNTTDSVAMWLQSQFCHCNR